MRINVFSDSWKGMIKTSSYLLASNVILSLVVVALTFGVLRKESIVTLVPPHMTKEATIGIGTANAEYLMSFGMYVASLTGNLTPNNVVFVADALGSIVDPKLYSVVRRELYALASDPLFKNRGGAVYFEPMNVFYDAPTGKVFVKGNQVSVTSTGEQNRTPFVYEIQVEIRDRMPTVVAFDKYPGTQPHTMEWERKNQGQSRRAKMKDAEAEADKEATPWFSDAIRYGAAPPAMTTPPTPADPRRSVVISNPDDHSHSSGGDSHQTSQGEIQ